MRRVLGPNILHGLLLQQAQETSSIAEAEHNLRVLHAVLVTRIEQRKGEGYAPNEKEVYAELKTMMEEGKRAA